MFTIDLKITERDLKGKNLYKALFSMNNHQVATPETSLEVARSYIFIFREGKKRLSAYVGLHFFQTDRKLFYSHSANPFLEDERQGIEDEARYFAEDLGAMLDEMDFSNRSDQEKLRWLDEQELFGQKKEPEPELTTTVPSATPPSEAVPAPVAETVQPGPREQPAPVEEPLPVPQAPPAPESPAAVAPPEETRPAPPPGEPEAQPVEPQPQPIPDEKPLGEATRKRQETIQKALKTNSAKTPKQPSKREPSSSPDVVSRDREALARLLTSF